MLDGPLFVLTLLAALGSGLVAGMFYAFSALVMRALAALPPAQGVAAMQSINTSVYNAWFMGAFLGTTVLNAVVLVLALVIGPEGATIELLLGSVLYLVGAFGVTAAANVPRNKALEGLAPEAPESAGPWREYVAGWTTWNSVRTVGALASCAFLVFALAG